MNAQFKLGTIDKIENLRGRIASPNLIKNCGIDIISFQIGHNKIYFPELILNTKQKINELDSIFVLYEVNSNNVLFVGGHNQYTYDYRLKKYLYKFESKPDNYMQQSYKAAPFFKITERANIFGKNPPVFWSSMELCAKSIFDKNNIVVREISDHHIFNIISEEQSENIKKDRLTFVVYKEINKTFTENIGSKIFGEYGLNTMTPDNLLNDWPAEIEIMPNIKVIESDISKTKSAEYFILNGKLVVSGRVIESLLEIYEVRESGEESDGENIEIYVDWSKYFAEIDEWRDGVEYKAGDNVLFWRDGRYANMVCNCDHKSDENNIKTMWNDTGLSYDKFDECFASSEFGKSVLLELVKYYKLNKLLFKNISKRIQFKALITHFLDLDILDRINFNGNEYVVVDYRKYIGKNNYVIIDCMDSKCVDEIKNLELEVVDSVHQKCSDYANIAISNSYVEQMEKMREGQEIRATTITIGFCKNPRSEYKVIMNLNKQS
jgi:hypothetical protein